MPQEVYIVTRSEDYEGEHIIDIFDNIDAARECLAHEVEDYNRRLGRNRIMSKSMDEEDTYHCGCDNLYIERYEVSTTFSK